MATRKLKIEDGVDPVVEDYDDSDSDSDLEGFPDGASDPDSEDEAPEEIERKQTLWAAEQAIKYYNDKHQDVEYVLVNPVCSTGYFIPQATIVHCLFTAKNVSSSSSSSSGSNPPAPKADDSGSSATPSLSATPPTPMVVASYGYGSSSYSRCLTLTPDVELFFAETALYPESELDVLTIHYCEIMDQRGPVPPDIGCFYCSTGETYFYHPPKELLKYCDPDVTTLEYDDWTSSP